MGVARDIGVAVIGVLAFRVAFQWNGAGPLIILYLLCLYRLAWLKSARSAVYIGFAAGLAAIAPQLTFFYGIFGIGAVALWAVLAAWLAAFVIFVLVLGPALLRPRLPEPVPAVPAGGPG